MGSVQENREQRNNNKRKVKDVWCTLLQIGVWNAPSDSRLHHRPRRTDHHSHRDNCQRGQILKVCQRGGLRGQGRLHRSDHQVLRLRRLLWHPLLHPPFHRSSNEASLPPHLLDRDHPRLQHQISLRLHQGVRHQQRWRRPRLWCSTSL